MSQLGYTQGTGSEVKTDQGATTGAHLQMLKLAEGIAGSENLLPGTVAKGLLVEVSGVDTAVAIDGTVACTQSGTWDVAVSGVAGTVTVQGNVGITGAPAISGTVNVDQSLPASTANAWPVRITDGTNLSHLTLVSGTYAFDVNVAKQAAAPGAQADKTSFTEGSGIADVAAGVYNDSPVSAPGANQAAALRITPNRGLHVNLRNQAGTEIGTSSNAVRIDPLGITTQPVSGTVTADIKDSSGNAFSISNPLFVQNLPSLSNIWKAHVTYGASQTDQTIYSPPSGKTVYVEGYIITPTTGGAILKIYDQTDSASTELFDGQPPAASIVVTPSRPIPLSAVNNILRYATGSAAAGDITAWGFYQ